VSHIAQEWYARDAAVTIGVFDGVHRGHRHLLERLGEVARQTGRKSVVLTLKNHPASVLRPDFEARYLTSLEDRLRLIREVGVELLLPVSFDIELSRLTAREFAVLLRSHVQMRDLVVGPDFAMGRNREGDVETLAALGAELGFSLHVVEPLLDDVGRPVRSTHVRDALSKGDVATAAELLGRNYALSGTVVAGQGRGGPLGFPTANLEVPVGMAVPADGIYAAWAHVAGERRMAAASIGVRPTFDDGARAVEAFILDFDGDLYGREVGLEFVRWLRPETRFDTVEALQEQIRRDVAGTRAMLEPGPAASGSGSHGTTRMAETV
jgi:riboflavin kinase/FMN adenylyltransferase